jgi:hypothetical protein
MLTIEPNLNIYPNNNKVYLRFESTSTSIVVSYKFGDATDMFKDWSENYKTIILI